MAVEAQTLRNLLTQHFPDAEIELRDTVGDMDHYELKISSVQFNGISKISQHRLVMAALGDMFGGKLHAISINTIPK